MNETYREFIGRKQRANDALIKSYRAGHLTREDLNRMVENGEITVARMWITIGSAS